MIPAPPPLSADNLPEPSEAQWSWARDKQTNEWLLRSNHFLDDSAKAAWAGAEVTVTAASGRKAVRRLVACRYSGQHNGGWCLWLHSEPNTPDRKQREANARFIARMKRRASDVDLLNSLDDNAPLDDAMRAQAEACKAAAVRLTALDLDHAQVINAAGWSQADGIVGRMIAGIDTAFWTKATLAGAKAVLWKYHNTQLPADLVATIWPEALLA